MAKQQINIRLDAIHMEFLEKGVEALLKLNPNTNKTDLIQRALYEFVRDESILGSKVVSEIIDKHYKSF